MRILALDVGDRRIGVAISDESGLLARSLEVVIRDGTDFERIARLIEENDVGSLLVGCPRNMDSSYGDQASKVEAYVDGLLKRIDIPVKFWDERLSTVEAHRIMIKQGHRTSSHRKWIDAVAAAVILQDYLDSGKGREKR